MPKLFGYPREFVAPRAPILSSIDNPPSPIAVSRFPVFLDALFFNLESAILDFRVPQPLLFSAAVNTGREGRDARLGTP